MYPETFLSRDLDLTYVAKVLDELGPSGRLDTLRHFEGEQMARLWEAAKGFRPLSLASLVPEGTEPLTEIVHEGKNSLPDLPGLPRFQKRFCKPSASGAAGDVLYGYNHQAHSWFSGPGYFVARPSAEDPGAIDIDYREVPKEKAPSWPALAHNRGPLSWIVFGGMVDILRGVSEHVTVGRARRRGKLTDDYFVLCRT